MYFFYLLFFLSSEYTIIKCIFFLKTDRTSFSHIKMKRFYINFFSVECKSDASQQTFYVAEKRTCSSNSFPHPHVHKPVSHSNKIDPKFIFRFCYHKCEKLNRNVKKIIHVIQAIFFLTGIKWSPS